MFEMAAVLFAVLDEVALEGSQGSGVRQLWDRLQLRLPIAGLAALDKDAKRSIWGLLLERSQDVSVVQRLPGDSDRWADCQKGRPMFNSCGTQESFLEAPKEV